jgi:NhaC family Na+:H+ antiporter
LALVALSRKVGALERLITPVIAAANSIAALIAALASAVLATNVATAEQYFAIALPGRMFKAAFEKRRLAPDRFPGPSVVSGTPRSGLIPCNSCGA